MIDYDNFKGNKWQQTIDVNDFIEHNYTEYLGDDSFLAPISDKTKIILERFNALKKEESIKGILDVETKIMSGIDVFEPGYIDKDNEIIFGLQTDKPLKRIVNPYGGIRMVNSSLEAYGYTLDEEVDKHFNAYRKTHNQGVFDAYTKEIRAARKSHLITGLPDAYGRGRIIGDYRRVSLYGIDYLIEKKKEDLNKYTSLLSNSDIQLREEISEQIRALEEIKSMASKYGFDISKPASNAKEAVQWLYFAYLAAIKENNGAAMSFGRTSTFLDIYIEHDLSKGLITENEVQELIDQLVLKLRLVNHLRTPEYNELFAGDPTWVTESIAGMLNDSKSLVTKTSFRFLHTLINLDSSPEPNLTVLWSDKLPENFKKYCAKISSKTDAIQYENDDVMRPMYGNDYAIACCVSAMSLGKLVQYFGARCNLAKVLLYALNQGIDEMSKIEVIKDIPKISEGVLEYEEVRKLYRLVMERTVKTYVDTMNVIHYMHDKYAYERSQMALHDTLIDRLTAFGIAGFSVVVDSLSAIKHAKVTPIREDGITVDFKIEGDYPKYGNDDDRVDDIAVEIAEEFINELRKHGLYRNAKHTLSILTITSNVVYGKNTGATPDGREAHAAFAPGANPLHGRDVNGALASLNSVAKIPYCDGCEDGISNTFSIVPSALGSDESSQINNLVDLLDGYFTKGAHHLNVNVLNREMLIDAMHNPDKYPNLTIRVSGYAVRFNKLNKEQQEEVISRTFHEAV
jgi:formate C-acetyltransferase